MSAEIHTLKMQDEACRRARFSMYEDAKREAQEARDYEKHRAVAEAYRFFLQACLDADPLRLSLLQDIVHDLKEELDEWRSGVRRYEP